MVTRSGSPIDLGHLSLVRPEKARSIIVLAPVGDPEPDVQVIKTILALTQGTDHRDRDYEIVAEIEDPTKLVVHSARQSGASVAFIELLDFAGDEIYFRDDPALIGRPFGDALGLWEECTAIGIIDGVGLVALNPEHGRVLVAGDRVIAVAEDDAALTAATPTTAEPVESAIADRKPALPRRRSATVSARSAFASVKRQRIRLRHTVCV